MTKYEMYLTKAQEELKKASLKRSDFNKQKHYRVSKMWERWGKELTIEQAEKPVNKLRGVANGYNV